MEKITTKNASKNARETRRERERERERERVKQPPKLSHIPCYRQRCVIVEVVEKHTSTRRREQKKRKEQNREQSRQDIFSFQNLLTAYRQCRNRKRKTINAAKFELNYEKGLLKIEWELKNGTYKPGKSICFVVTSPTPREVFAADFKDRIVHHLLVNYLEPIWEKKFIYHSYACRKDKGAHQALKDIRRSKEYYYLQADISAFFMSLKKDILYNIIKRHTKNPKVLWLTRKIIFHDPTQNFYCKSDPKLFNLIPSHKSLFHVPKGQGLPIGNLTSQFFANIYLNELDQFVKHRLKIKYYYRYVDDILLFHKNPNQLKIWHEQINLFLKENLQIHLHPQKSVLKSVSDGINFVGFITKPNYSLVRKRTVANLKRKLWQFNQSPIPPNAESFNKKLNQVLSTINSYYGQLKHANTFKLRKSIYQKHFKTIKSWLGPADTDFSHFRIKKYLEVQPPSGKSSQKNRKTKVKTKRIKAKKPKLQ